MNQLPGEILVRDALSSDAQLIAEFNLGLAIETEDLHLNAAILRLGVDRVLGDATKGRYFVAEAIRPAEPAEARHSGPRREVVGCTMITYEFSDWRNADLWWIQSVYVRQDWRRRGVFRALYRHVRQAALAAGAGGMRLYVEKRNEPAQETYRALGMQVSPYFMMSEMFNRNYARSHE